MENNKEKLALVPMFLVFFMWAFGLTCFLIMLFGGIYDAIYFNDYQLLLFAAFGAAIVGGSQVVLFDGSGTDFLCIIISLRNMGATLSVVEKKENTQSFRRNVWLCLSIIKKDNFELAVEKGVELGVNHFLPILSERSEKKSLNMERLEKIIKEASEQSGRSTPPILYQTTTLEKLFREGTLPQEKIALDPTGTPFHSYVVGNKFPSIAAFLGPEGGWSDKELDFFQKYNVPVLSLGTQILRAETAAISASSLLLL